MMELGDHDLEQIGVDISMVYAFASGVMINVRPYLEGVRAIACLEHAVLEHIEDDLLALGPAQALHLAATTPAAAIPALHAKLIEMASPVLRIGSSRALDGSGPMHGPITRRNSARADG
jgi:hypothetical protein